MLFWIWNMREAFPCEKRSLRSESGSLCDKLICRWIGRYSLYYSDSYLGNGTLIGPIQGPAAASRDYRRYQLLALRLNHQDYHILGSITLHWVIRGCRIRSSEGFSDLRIRRLISSLSRLRIRSRLLPNPTSLAYHREGRGETEDRSSN